MREEINYRMIPNKMNLHAGSEKRMRNAGVVEPESQEVSRQATNLEELKCLVNVNRGIHKNHWYFRSNQSATTCMDMYGLRLRMISQSGCHGAWSVSSQSALFGHSPRHRPSYLSGRNDQVFEGKVIFHTPVG